jgi:2-haloalkanoic acid dehalogenase type II
MMRASIDTITFDFYGTLVQWHEALSAAAGEILARHGLPDVKAAAMMHVFHIEGRRLRDAGAYQSYRAVLRESLRLAMETCGVIMTEADFDCLQAWVSKIAPHPEVTGVLAELKPRYRLAAISNTDDDLIAGSLESLGVELDAVITAQQARAYKPNPALFRYAHDVLDVTPQRVVHVAASQALDLTVCKSMGIRAIWVNRRGETLEPGSEPLAEVRDLKAVPALLLA